MPARFLIQTWRSLAREGSAAGLAAGRLWDLVFRLDFPTVPGTTKPVNSKLQ